MTLRSRQTRWFEVFVRQEQVVYALEALAGTHSIQLELDPRFAGSLNIKSLAKEVREFDRLADEYRGLLPDSAHKPTRLTGPPEKLVGQMLRQLRRWREQIAPLLVGLDELKMQRYHLQVLKEAATAMGDSASQLPRLAHTTELLFKRLYRCAPRQVEGDAFEDLLEQSFRGEEHCFVVVVCMPGQRARVSALLADTDCEEVVIPPDLTTRAGEQLADIGQRLDKINASLGHTETRIRNLQNDPRIAEALANIETLRWFIGVAHQVGVEDADFCHITGWTSETDPGRLEQVLSRARVDAEVRFTRPPAGARKPVANIINWWRQPFQIFTDMSGAPSPDEIDPTGLLAIVVPLLFGYMFPDTGHGLVIAVAGIVLSRYTPRARFLISCGLVAALMGILFDDFFGYPILNQAWQIHALDDPVLVLVIPLFFGMGLLLLGLIFNGIELYWRGELRRWLLSDAAVLLLYVSLLASLLFAQAVPVMVFALLWYIVGAAVTGGRRWASRMAVAVAKLLHSTLTLVLNTISFVRVGAFALAHSGLTLVVVTITAEVETPVLSELLFVVGQVMIVALEGLVVFVQTTRLVLFEFFMQFLRAEGRFFRPLSESKPPRDD